MYIQKNSIPPNLASFRILSPAMAGYPIHFSKDIPDCDGEKARLFLSSCAASIEEGISPDQIKVIAIGDFSEENALGWIDDTLSLLNGMKKNSDPKSGIYVWENDIRTGISVDLDYLVSPTDDFQMKWTDLLLHELFHARMEKSMRELEMSWHHPRAHFLSSRSSYVIGEEEDAEGLLSLMLIEVELIKRIGFTQTEFNRLKRSKQQWLQYLEATSKNPLSPLLASYYADEWNDSFPISSYPDYLAASNAAVNQVSFEDIEKRIESFLDQQHQRIVIGHPPFGSGRTIDASQVGPILEWAEEFSNTIDETTEEKNISRAVLHADGTRPQFCLAPAQPYASFLLIDNPSDPYYQLPINDHEKKIIHKIISTMAQKNVFQLIFEKKEMEKKGRKIDHIHPMRFIGYIFSDSYLKGCMGKVRESYYKWDAFVDGFSRRMKEEEGKQNLFPHVTGFCEQVNANPTRITELIQRREWEEILKTLL